MRLYRKRKSNGEFVWWGSWTEGGATRRLSTRCTTKAAAEIVVAKWERERADPAYAAAVSATLGSEASYWLNECDAAVRAGRLSKETADMYRAKTGHLLRLIGEHTPLADVDANVVANYINARREEPGARTGSKVGDSTIYKEWVALRGILTSARHRNHFHRDPASLKPLRFGSDYKPRTTFLTWEQLRALLLELGTERAATVAIVVATSSRRKEWRSYERADFDLREWTVRIRGTKTEGSNRTIPIPPEYRELARAAIVSMPIKKALKKGGTEPGPLFEKWGNARRDIIAACARASRCALHRAEGKMRPVAGCAACEAAHVPAVTWNDLRRTFSSLLLQGGRSNTVVAKLMGHTTTSMVDRVYGQQTTDSLRALLGPAPAPPVQAPIGDPPVNQTGATLVDSVASVEVSQASETRENKAIVGGPSGTRTRDLRIKRPAFGSITELLSSSGSDRTYVRNPPANQAAWRAYVARAVQSYQELEWAPTLAGGAS